MERRTNESKLTEQTANPTGSANLCECDFCRAESPDGNDPRFAPKVPRRRDLTKLKKKLLERAGSRFQRNDILAGELDRHMVKRLLEEGRFFDAEGVFSLPMIPGDCHGNAIILAVKEKMEWWTGFAMSPDGIWRLHSWVLNGNRIIETTEARAQYYGVPTPLSYFAERHAEHLVRYIRRIKELAKSRKAKAEKGEHTSFPPHHDHPNHVIATSNQGGVE